MNSAISSNTQTTILAVAVAVLFGWLYHKLKPSRPNLPPGSFGIGELMGLARALEGGTTFKWIEERVARHGPIFKTSFLGYRMVIVTGLVGNKFVFTSGDDALKSHQPVPVFYITGEKSIFEVHGARHKLVRGAIAGFLRPESLQRSVPLMSSLIKRYLVKGGWVLPIYLPFTHYYRAIAARRRIYDRFSVILDERRRRLEDGSLGPNDDVVTAMLTMRDEEGRAMPRPEILDNLITVMFASHDTVVSLNASFVRRLAMDVVTLEA
ncbi:Taxane 10-beta-hydroxylase [Acorus gramineus]|uniref:Taxane 10-beta-hydroxylase n=1 Tax=Acorus gramineus TaxID=55184 RepID=A0AAV9B641_ACOGR|nr:Taxane 10-beta-hydroxylase [Acorus gramineus]